MVTVYTLAYNEELLVNFMIDHYRERFPNCPIVIYDNMSTDNTVEIAKFNDCEVRPFDTNNEFQDRRNMEIKNSCWKDAKTDWVLICDLDELLDINEEQLKEEERLGTTIVRSDTYDMINLKNNLDLESIKYGVKSPIPGKICLFNKNQIKEMNYGPGAHSCDPEGNIKYSKSEYKLYHYNSISEEETIRKFKERGKRLSPENLKNGWGNHYFMTPNQIRQEYKEEREKAVKIRD